MSARDLVLTLVIFSSLPFCFFKPWVGVLVYSWIGYMNPHRLTWVVNNYPFALWASAATFAGLMVTRDRQPMPRTREVWLLGLFWFVTLLSTAFAAFYPVDAWDQFSKVTKILLGTCLTLVLFQDVRKLRWLLWVIAGSIGFYGLKGGIWALTTGGGNQVLGPPGSFIAGNTEIGLALNMILPMLLILRRSEKRVWLRHLLLAAFIFTIPAILITYSRGAFLGLAAILLILAARSRAKVLALSLLLVGVPLAMHYLPSKWFDKMETIQTYEEDSSAMGRIWAWRLATRIGADRPLLGAGFQCFSKESYARYLPEAPFGGTDAHNIFYQVLAEHGVTGLLAYVALLISTILTLWKIKRQTKRIPHARELYNWAEMIEVSLIAFIASGFFLSRSYFDLFYHLITITIVLSVIARRVARGESVPGLEAPVAARIEAPPRAAVAAFS